MHLSSNDASHIAYHFFNSGFAVAAFDQEGHGKSDGPRGTIISLDSFAGDCEKFILKTKSLYPVNTQIFVLGLSMGGALSVMMGLRIPDLIKGALLFGPALGVAPDFEPSLQRIVRFLNFCCCSGLRLKAIDQNLASRNPHYPQYFHENPEFFAGKLNARTGAAMLNGLQNLELQRNHFDRPVIIFHGGQDKLADPKQSKEFIENCKSNDKELVVYDGMYHVVFHEPEIHEILERCVKWINERI
jgi:alpha-beta hydrolase superfamily lysophospholipase